MIFLSTKKLKKAWKSDTLSQREKMIFFLISNLGITLLYYLPRQSSEIAWINSIEILCMLPLTIIGIGWVFLKNGGNKGTDFISKFITFSVPVGFQVLLIAFITNCIYEKIATHVITSNTLLDKTHLTLDIGYLGLSILIEIIYFWLIGNQLSQLRSHT